MAGTYSAPPWMPTATTSASERARSDRLARAAARPTRRRPASPARREGPARSRRTRAARRGAGPTSTILGSKARAADGPPPTATIPALESAPIVSVTVCGPASPAWLLAIPIASNPAAARSRADAGRRLERVRTGGGIVRAHGQRRLEVRDREVGARTPRTGCPRRALRDRPRGRHASPEHHVAGEEQSDRPVARSGRGDRGDSQTDEARRSHGEQQRPPPPKPIPYPTRAPRSVLPEQGIPLGV